jgi:ribosome-binding factor A
MYNNKREAKIKQQKTESILKELIPEALASLSDERLHGLAVVNVVCSRGRSDAKIYLDPAFIFANEEQPIIRLLIKARLIIEKHVANEQGWFRTPKLSFTFDDTLSHENKMTELFKKIGVDLHDEN